MLNETYNKIALREFDDLTEYGIKELQGGLTLEIIKEKFPWLLKAKMKDAVITLWKEHRPAEIFFKKGTWLDGTWQDGVFSGVWENGVFKYGYFEGTWNDGVWEDGYFAKAGKWRGGVFKKGVFLPLNDLRKYVVNQYLRLYDAGKLTNSQELEKLIPGKLLNNSKLNYTDMFKKMSIISLSQINKYLTSK